MKNSILEKLIIKKPSRLWDVVYWLFAAIMLFIVFSNRDYSLNLRFILVLFLVLTGYGITQIVSRHLIPKLLFKGKVFRFFYFLFGLFITSLWLITLSVFSIVFYSVFYLPHILAPQREDMIILVGGLYLVVAIAALVHFIRELYKEMKERSAAELEKQAIGLKLEDARLRLLQAQIHPHFLFNMLNNMYGLAEENPAKTKEIIIKLSGLLDYMLYDCERDEASLASEIAFIYDYVDLERIRHDTHFDVEINIQEVDEEIMLAPLLLFPFVENAFKHGLKTRTGFIKISLYVENKFLIFNVKNDTFKKRSVSDKALGQEGRGIGLKNIRDRLELLYPERHRLLIDETKDTFETRLEIQLTV